MFPVKGLILDTSSNSSFALLAEGALPLASLSLGQGPELSKNLGSLLHEFLKDTPINFIAVGIGPGSYTGIRVGAALAQALAFGWKIPLFSFCSLLVFMPPKEAGPSAVLLDSGACFKETTLSFLSFKDSLKELEELTLFSPHPEKLQPKINKPVLQAELNLPFLAAYCCEEAPLKGGSALNPLPFIYSSLS